MFHIENIDMSPVFTGEGAPELHVHMDGEALITLIQASDIYLEAMRSVWQQTQSEAIFDHLRRMFVIRQALTNALTAIDHLDVCDDCGRPMVEHGKDEPEAEFDPESVSDENLASVVDLFAKQMEKGEEK